MIVPIVTFKLPKRWTVQEAAAVFKSTAPTYLGKPGLVRKHYHVTEGGDRAGGHLLLEEQGGRRALPYGRMAPSAFAPDPSTPGALP